MVQLAYKCSNDIDCAGGEPVKFVRKIFLPIVLFVLLTTPTAVFAYDDGLVRDASRANLLSDFPIIPLPDPDAEPQTVPQNNNEAQQPYNVQQFNSHINNQFNNHTVHQPNTMLGQNQSAIEFSLSQRLLTRREEGMDILGYVPNVPTTFSAHHHINSQIDDAVTQMISEARHMRARSIRFTHEHYTNHAHNVVSIVIYAEVSSVVSRTLVRSVNFDMTSGWPLTANEAMGMIDIISLGERILVERVRRDPARYYAARSVNLNSRAFYVTNDGIVFLFDEFQLSTASNGVQSIELHNSNIRRATVSPWEYHHMEGGYNLLMMPLRHIVETQLGYRIAYNWDAIGMRIEVWNQSRVIIEMRTYFNEYEVIGMLQRSLESAPRNIDGTIYVPITFFDQILPLTTYSVDMFGMVTFLSYVE